MSAVAEAPRARTVRAPHGLPRVLAGLRGKPVDLDAHLERYGPHPAARLGRDLIGLIEQSGLRGRGGASFPVAAKLAAVASRRGAKVVVVNAVEGEPVERQGPRADPHAPHLVLDGAALAAEAVGAGEAIVAVGGASGRELAALADAIDGAAAAVSTAACGCGRRRRRTRSSPGRRPRSSAS